MTINVSPIDKLSFENLMPAPPVHSESANIHSYKNHKKLENFLIGYFIWFVTKILGKRAATSFS